MSEDRNGSRKPRRSDHWETEPMLEEVLSELLALMVSGEISSKKELQDSKITLLKDRGIRSIPTNSMLLDMVRKRFPDKEATLIHLLQKKPTRTLSGVAVVAVMTSPYPCPHGKCIFCPGGSDQEVPTPQSYTGSEPAAMRAAQNEFDPGMQVERRLQQLEATGHPTDKVDLILMGGTITARPLKYQIEFVKGCLDGMNGNRSNTFEEAADQNETGPQRCIGMTFETRPDWFNEEEADLILNLGATRLELGIQSAFDGPLVKSRRGHTVEESIEATCLAKDTGLKVGYHLMPGIPGSTPEMDIETGRRIFEDPRFMPDMLKIYPTLVIKGTELYDMWKSGDYEPLSTEDAANVVAEIKRMTPPWVRIQRVQRDIPSPLVESGVKKSNLRQLARKVLESRGLECRCIRCREIGHRISPDGGLPLPEDVTLERREYEASHGKEVFLSFEVDWKDALVGYLRLRRPSPRAHRSEVQDAGIVRELKVFGPMVPIGKNAMKEWQHRGYGGRLLEYACSVVRDEWGLERILVTSGIGAREYYRKFGFERIGPYMGKDVSGS
ncbi:MAG: tRNA uridine(34) 5-carboxymethylaminomethyl modification radical SAM/GNAT enzyme Elp3 [Thermoplasmatota archaeon]